MKIYGRADVQPLHISFMAGGKETLPPDQSLYCAVPVSLDSSYKLYNILKHK
jgi:hypothetical protein